MEEVLNEFFNFLLTNIQKQSLKSCPQCNSFYVDIIKQGQLGCPNCWNYFNEELELIVKKTQNGNVEHVGKIPKRWKEAYVQNQKNQIPFIFKIKILEAILEKTISLEHYEQAIKLRDKIKHLKELGHQYEILKISLEQAVLKEKPIDDVQNQMNEILHQINQFDVV